MILPNADLDAAFAMAARLRETIGGEQSATSAKRGVVAGGPA